MRDVTRNDLDAAAHRLEMDRWTCRRRRELWRSARGLPLRFGLTRALRGGALDLVANRFDDRIRVATGGHGDVKLVPQPSARCREVEVVSLDRKAVRERDATACRVPGSAPFPRLEQHRVEQAELHDLAGHAVDLHEIADADAVLAHQHEPAEERDDEILQCDG